MPYHNKYSKLGIDDQIMDYSYSHHDNRNSVIAKHFGVSIGYVSRTIENNLADKKHYDGRK